VGDGGCNCGGELQWWPVLCFSGGGVQFWAVQGPISAGQSSPEQGEGEGERERVGKRREGEMVGGAEREREGQLELAQAPEWLAEIREQIGGSWTGS